MNKISAEDDHNDLHSNPNPKCYSDREVLPTVRLARAISLARGLEKKLNRDER